MSLFLETFFLFLTLEILTNKMVPRTEDQKGVHGGPLWPTDYMRHEAGATGHSSCSMSLNRIQWNLVITRSLGP